ncbi:DeoR family transcriptional regulator [Thermomonas brevis]|uniref:DeoR family transcriptional regulator n=1 Tax=Thermomonas brevis TaxID=215691 RepID=A0A7G9QX32_9GAMM|nr:DeoR family transcriptional regulator [Thermomonas brevis]QNN47907.1 DeoR family transcriptional regulator [Thermomonas brevis]
MTATPAPTTRNTRQRRQRIVEQLLQQGSVQVGELVERHGVSAVTIRADLNHLESQGLAVRSHGGASLLRMPPQERDIHEKDTLNLPLKDAIGARAAQLVKPGDNIILDSGSTTMMLARHLRGQRDVTVMTNGLNIAWELAGAPGIVLRLTGGLLHQPSLSLHGSQAEASLHSYGFDTLFLGVDGLDLQFGATTHHEPEASLNHRMVERSRRIVVLTDSSKFGKVSLHRIARLDEIHTVITDAGIGEEYRDGLQRLGIELIVA